MSATSRVLRSSAEAVAGAVAECAERPDLTETVRRLIDQLAEGGCDREGLNLLPLRTLCPDAAVTAGLLRLLEGRLIEQLRSELDEDAFLQAARPLRMAFRKSIPRPETTPRSVALFRRLLEGNAEAQPPDVHPLQTLFTAMSDTLNDFVVVHNRAGDILYMNTAALRATGYAAADLLEGLSVFDFVAPEFLPALENRLSQPGAAFDFPYRSEAYACDGRRIPLEVRNRALTLQDGGEELVIVIARELSGAPVNELAGAAGLSAYIEEILGSAPIGILLTDPQGVVTDANAAAARLWGAPDRQAMTGRPASEGQSGRIEALDALCRGALDKNTEQRGRISGTTAFGAQLHADVMAAPLREPDGQAVRLLLIAVDVSDKAALERSMVQMEKLCALGEIVAGVAHDLNNPLTGIAGYADLLLMTEVPAAVRGRVEHILHEAERSRQIVQNLLGFARAHGAEKAAHSMNQALEDTLTLREHQLNTERIDVVRQFDPHLPKVRIDYHEVQRVIMNMINNAQHAFRTVNDGREKKLTLTTRGAGDKVFATIADNGPGISATDQERVFNAFYTTKPPGEGTGLGLSMAADIIRDHGGEILLKSQEGEGTAFTIVLPAEAEEPPSGREQLLREF